jgi:alginate O-acetyltransferase complex protein AlgI
MLTTFVIVLFAWIFFRSTSIAQALLFIQHMLSADWLVIPEFKKGIIYVGLIVIVEWFQRSKQHALQIEYLPPALRWIIYYGVIGALFWYGHTGHVPFIYFQF